MTRTNRSARARMTLGGALALALISVVPTTASATESAGQVTIEAPKVIPAEFLVGGEVTVSVSPADYTGTITVRTRDGRRLGSAPAASGSATIDLAAPELGRVPVTITTGGAATETSIVDSRGVSLWPGDRSAAVTGLLDLLREQRYLTPEPTERFSRQVEDVVRAFQKVHELKPTGRVTPALWQTITEAEPVAARHRSRGTHLEVDKTRQIMLVVRNGRVSATIHVSTGHARRSPTPEGRFRIYAKNVGTLFRFMPFLGNYGFHGYPEVPNHPASAGCIREPMWTADWIYDQTKVGTPVFIYS